MKRLLSLCVLLALFVLGGCGLTDSEGGDGDGDSGGGQDEGVVVVDDN